LNLVLDDSNPLNSLQHALQKLLQIERRNGSFHDQNIVGARELKAVGTAAKVGVPIQHRPGALNDLSAAALASLAMSRFRFHVTLL
jgi:hypothetical protein